MNRITPPKAANNRRSKMTGTVALIFLTVIMLFSVGQTSDSQSGAAEQEVRKLERAWLDAYEQHDVKAMNAIVADDFIITFPDGTKQTKPQIIDSIKTPRSPANPQKFYTEDVRARVYGETVILTGRVISEFQRDGKSVKEQMLYTDTYVRRNGRWQVVASHLSNTSKTDDALREEMTKRHIAGASVAVIRNGKVILARGYGSANVEQPVPAAAETIYQIGSTTKPFTATAIMMLVESGGISLDEEAAEYLPKLPAQYSEVTIRQLLTHTSGVNRDLRRGNVDDFTIDEFWKRLATAPISFKPGERWEYSNTGYILLGMIVESVAKKSYGEFLSERIFKPLGMKDTKYLEPPGNSRDRAVGYDWVEGAFRPSPYFSGGYGAGGLVSTVIDLAKWDVGLDAEKLLNRSSLEQMWTPAKLSNGGLVSFDFRGEQSSYGFGWFLTSYRGRRVVTHGGTVSGFSSQVMRFVDDKVTIIVISNSKSGADRAGHAEFITQRVADIHVPNLAPVSSNR